jgi:hypothetical protein
MKPVTYSSVAGRPVVPAWTSLKAVTLQHRRTLQYLIEAIKRPT